MPEVPEALRQVPACESVLPVPLLALAYGAPTRPGASVPYPEPLYVDVPAEPSHGPQY